VNGLEAYQMIKATWLVLSIHSQSDSESDSAYILCEYTLSVY
jgi:hypothetical protein